MKNTLLFLLLSTAITLVSCGGDAKQTPTTQSNTDGAQQVEQPVIGQANVYASDLANSMVTWKGSKVTGSFHTGIFKLKDGKLAMSNGKVIAADVDIDISSLAVTDDMDDGGKQKLAGHLLSPDFFETEKYPTAKFLVQKVQPIDNPTEGYNYTFAGQLTLKGKTAPITIPANVTNEGSNVRVKSPAFILDRTKWEISYGSGLVGAVGDKVINDEVEMSIDAIFVPN